MLDFIGFLICCIVSLGLLAVIGALVVAILGAIALCVSLIREALP